MLRKIKQILPFLFLFSILGFLGLQLFYAKKELPSALIGETIPTFALPSIYPSQKMLTSQAFFGQVSLLNIWATWCTACAYEHPTLMKIKDQYHVPIYGIVYKDNVDEVKSLLDRNGNPYLLIGDDSQGDVAIDLGVYGTPETFVISPRGKIIYRYVGALDEKAWRETLYPLIQKYEIKQ